MDGFPSYGHSHLSSKLINQNQFGRNQKGQKTTKVLKNGIQTWYLMTIKYFKVLHFLEHAV
jgi:hypothetical protein